ncbi:uridine kinase [Angustibacter sp. McL0619]|uniref:uridine kinase n=1 Tax=Angustibacter sp. McL0619 TaxID=3415676 RepID=UPI003CF6AC04
MPVSALSPEALADQLISRARRLATAAMAAGHAVRVGVDGCVPADGTALADLVARRLTADGVATARVRQADFQLPRAQRLEHGARDSDVLWDGWYDDGALRREVLDPLGPGAASTRHPMQWLPTLRDPATDRSTREAPRDCPPGAVLVVDGRFLLRWELADGFDMVAHLQTSAAAQARRLADDDERARAVPSWQRYLDGTDPASRADLVVRFDHPDRPALLG